jgi:hypothetical protein
LPQKDFLVKIAFVSMMKEGVEPIFRRGIHQWVINAEKWSIEDWRGNLTNAPTFFLWTAEKICSKTLEGREELLARAMTSSADNVIDYVRYEMMVDLCSLNIGTVEKLRTALTLNTWEGALMDEGFDWDKIYKYTDD